jgi:hypothetical protein
MLDLSGRRVNFFQGCRFAPSIYRGGWFPLPTRQPWPMPGPSIRSMRVSEQFSIVKASAASGSRSSASASAARIVPPCATAMMSRPE